MSIQLETDRNGQIIAKPVIGWTTATVAGMSVILAIRYIETLAEIETGGKSLQLALTPQQCLQLSETLNKKAKRILEDQPLPGKPLN